MLLFYEKMHEFEFERSKRLDALNTYPLAIMALMSVILAYTFKNLPKFALEWSIITMYAVFSVVSIILLIAIGLLVAAEFNSDETLIGEARKLDDYINYIDQKGENDTQVYLIFKDLYIDAASKNYKTNNYRTKKIGFAVRFMTVALLLTLLLTFAGYLNNIVTEYAIKTETVKHVLKKGGK